MKKYTNEAQMPQINRDGGVVLSMKTAKARLRELTDEYDAACDARDWQSADIIADEIAVLLMGDV